MSKFLSFKEKLTVFSLIFLISVAFIFWIGSLYLGFTNPIPKKGGEYVEGIIGQPLYINPLLSQTSEADADLSQLIYSGLFKYNSEGKIENNLAEGYEVSEDQKNYTVHLRKGLVWHDGEPLTAGDVVFTVNILQDPSYKSPLRQNWQGITVSETDDYTLDFSLANPYFGFLNNLTVGILPKHIWGNIAPEKFSLADYNLKPIGSGPYKFVNFQKNSNGEILSFGLQAFDKYFEGEPYISRIILNFYPDEDSMITAYNKKEIKGMESINPEKISSIKNKKSTNIKEISSSRYFSVFYNQTKSVALANDSVREALDYAVNKKEIIDKVLGGKGTEINSPFLTSMEEYNDDIEARNFDPKKAESILDDAGWKKGDDGIREKNGAKLQFKIQTADWPDLTETANILAEEWNEIGADVSVESLPASDLQQNIIRPREYEALVFGQVSSFNPDLYPFWHSSQKQDPGFNLGMLDDKNADELLRDIRQEPDNAKRVEKYKKFQEILAKEIPASFLYGPYYLYPISSEVKGVDVSRINIPSSRFSDVNKWYIKTKRVRK